MWWIPKKYEIIYPNSECLSGKCVCKLGYAPNTVGTNCYSMSEADCTGATLVCDNSPNSQCISGKYICKLRYALNTAGILCYSIS